MIQMRKWRLARAVFWSGGPFMNLDDNEEEMCVDVPLLEAFDYLLRGSPPIPDSLSSSSGPHPNCSKIFIQIFLK